MLQLIRGNDCNLRALRTPGNREGVELLRKQQVKHPEQLLYTMRS